MGNRRAHWVSLEKCSYGYCCVCNKSFYTKYNVLSCEAASQAMSLIGQVLQGEGFFADRVIQACFRVFHSIQGKTRCSHMNMLKSCLCCGNIWLRPPMSKSRGPAFWLHRSRYLAQLQHIRVLILFIIHCDCTLLYMSEPDPCISFKCNKQCPHDWKLNPFLPDRTWEWTSGFVFGSLAVY